MPSATNLRVTYGETPALHDIDLTAAAGEVCAVVGGDGAGKTTLLRTFAGRLTPDRGEIDAPPRERLGFQPATSGTWQGLTVAENLEFVSRAYRLNPATARERAGELIERAGLTQARDRLARHLSGGMRQKLGFVLAILHQPDLVLLDEPTTGVDPVSRVELWRLIAEAAAEGRCVVMATTYLDEAERAHQVLALDAGRAIASGAPDALLAGVPGALAAARERPQDTPHTWRRGRGFHAWYPAADCADPIEPDMEDAMIVYELAAHE